MTDITRDILVRPARIRSWLDPNWSRHQAFKLGERLIRELHGEHAVFLTLTYDRTPYDDGEDLYHRQSEEKHVRNFIRRLSRYLGQNLNGRWIRKLEFQRNGWVHWHLIIRGVKYIPHADLLRVWSHGGVHISRVKKKTLRYFAKYVAKPGDFPAWLLGLRSRSLKLVNPSPLFWRNTKDESPAAPKRDYVHQRKPHYVPLAQRFRDSYELVVAYDGRYPRVYRISFIDLISAAHDHGGVESHEKGWIAINSTTLNNAVAERRAREAGRRRPTALTLKNVQDQRHPGCEWVHDIVLDRALAHERADMLDAYRSAA